MVKRICRDCRTRVNEHPKDPAPRLCPDCYRTRLQRLLPQGLNIIESFGWDIFLMWAEEALVEIGGETPEAARRHVAGLARGESISYEEWLGEPKDG